MPSSVSLWQVLLIALIFPIIIRLIEEFIIKRYFPIWSKVDLHLHDNIKIGFDSIDGHKIQLYGMIKASYAPSLIRNITLSTVHERTSETHKFQLAYINTNPIDILVPPIPFSLPIPFTVSNKADCKFNAIFAEQESYNEQKILFTNWYKDMWNYSIEKGGIDSPDFQNSYPGHESTINFTKKLDRLFFWREGEYVLEVKIFKEEKKEPDTHQYKFNIPPSEIEPLNNNKYGIATILPSESKIKPYFHYSTLYLLKEVKKLTTKQQAT